MSARDFSLMRKDPFFASSGVLLFFYKRSSAEGSATRIGISVSKKISSKAPDRNYLKRRIREEFRRSSYRLLGKDVMIVVNKKKFDSMENAKRRLKADLLAGFKKIADS